MPGDGWGGALAAEVRSALGTLAGLRLRTRGSSLDKRGDFEVRGAGAELDPNAEGDFPSTYNSGVTVMREYAEVRVCVSTAAGDDLSLYPLANAAIVRAQQEGWQDPDIEYLEPEFADKSESDLKVIAGFRIGGRVQGLPPAP